MILIKNLANLITVSRIVCAVIVMYTTPFSELFWALYLYCGISDIADGLIARIMRQQSSLGANLDSIADVVFIFSIIFTVGSAVVVPTWLWICTGIITLIRVTAYLIGYKKHHTFSALHTYANKATGGILFCMPILIYFLGISVAGLVICIFATLASSEELLITVLSKELNPNRKSISNRLE